ncbi:MAG: hypothetical protein WKF88_09235 [Ferruginibacter sp.]
MLTFTINIKNGFRTHNLRVRQIYLDQRKEQMKIGSDRRHMIIETNRPFFRNKGLKHRNPDVKLISGDVPRGTLYDEIIREVIRMADEASTGK